MAKKRGPSVERGLLLKSREAALNAVQTFNNPLTAFKAETFIVLMNIAWMYLLHAYYRQEGVEYRYYQQGPQRRRFDRFDSGAFKYWGPQPLPQRSSLPAGRAYEEQPALSHRSKERNNSPPVSRCG